MRTAPTDIAGARPAGGTYPVDGVLLALAALGAAGFAATRVDPFTTDSLAYLDVAANLREGRGAVQSVVDFWRPAVPDPLGLWPPLYPALVALLGATGVPLEAAARAIPLAGFAAFAFAFHALLAPALGRGLAALTTLLALATPGVGTIAVHAWSEAPFLAFLTAGLALATGGAGSARSGAGRPVVAGLLLGLAAITRHAGLPLALAAAAVAVFVPAARRRLGLPFAAGALAPPLLWVARNLVTFGRPLGPALPEARAGLTTQAIELGRALRWELLPAPFDQGLALAVPLLLVLAAGVALAVAGRSPRAGHVAALVALLLLATVLAATSTSAINAPGGRYLAPALPFLLAASVAGLAGLDRASLRHTLVTGGVAVLALAAAVALPGAAGDAEAARRRALEARSDRAALAWLAAGGRDPVLSDAGHLVRAASGRSAVQIPPPAFRPRDYGAADDARWAGAGVDEALMAGGPPPAGAWRRTGTAGRFTRWARTGAPAGGAPR